MEYRFIDNKGDYFNPGFFTEDFLQKVKTESGKEPDEIKSIRDKFTGLNVTYKEYKKHIVNGRLSPRFNISETHDFNTEMLKLLGYGNDEPYKEWMWLDSASVVPVRHIIRDNSGNTKVVVMEMQSMIPIGDTDPDGLLQQYYDEGEDEAKGKPQRYKFSDWREVINLPLQEGVKIRPAVINRAVDEIFQLDDEKQRPNFVLILAGNKIFLLDRNEWYRGSYVVFDIDELLVEAAAGKKDYFALLWLLISRESLLGLEGGSLTAKVHDASVRNAVAVTKDLKEGVIKAVEEIANEAIWQLKQRGEEDKIDATKLRDDALTFVYRLLFLFYAEARPELGILPMRDDSYLHGYSLEMLRDLEQVPMHGADSRSGYFFDNSIRRLFQLIHTGYNDSLNPDARRFVIKKVDSPLFDDSKLNLLSDIQLRNEVWQRIIESLSLSQEKGRQRRGRISYSNLGINQLGSVYESLLAYRGFYTDEDYIEVHKAGKPEEGTYIVPRVRMDDFEEDEILRNKDGDPVIHEVGKFLYRLNGRDRKKSASYYTPEVLTKSTVKYTLKGFRDRLDKGEMTASDLLELKILEPAMGAAAFQNEVINQLAEMYIEYRQKEQKEKGAKNWRIQTEKRPTELQKVKAYIAVKNTYGVDLNNTAIELGKLALWLNVMYKDMETPWFSHHLAWGNAVIGAWFKTVNVEEGRHDYTQKPEKIKFDKKGTKVLKRGINNIYHFLLPDPTALGILKDSATKKESDPEKIKLMQDRRKDWISKLTLPDINRLNRLSNRIDRLISEAIVEQQKIDAGTEPSIDVWGLTKKANSFNFSYNDKQKLSDRRLIDSEAYARLKMAMDYWCALWFWRVEDADSLPDRKTFWEDIEDILGRDKETYEYEPSYREKNIFPEFEQPTLWDVRNREDEENQEEEVPAMAMEEYVAMIKESSNEADSRTVTARDKIVKRLADRYRFFHPMLEFIEVFSKRGGFDIIAGNPPWLKLTFTHEEVTANYYPEVDIHNFGAPKTAKELPKFKEANPKFAKYYDDELYEYEGSIEFMNADTNYALLKGQQTNLFKCVLVNGFDLMNDNGFIGMLHPEGVYEDPNGEILRKDIYQRLRFHFQYENELKLFTEVHPAVKFSSSTYRSKRTIDFFSISNLFHPLTVDDSYSHNGFGECYGLKKNGKWNVEGHKDRIVHFNEHSLKVIARTFEDEKVWDKCKLVSIHNKHIVEILDKLSNFPNRTEKEKKIITVCLDETLAVNDGTIRRETRFPEMHKKEMIFSGPHIYVGNPIYKTPKEQCLISSDYDTVNLEKISDNYLPRTNYIPIISGYELKEKYEGFDSVNRWMDYYRVAFRKMIGLSNERSLIGAIIPPNTAHIFGLISVTFPTKNKTVEFAGLTSSIILDFYIKTIGAANLMENRINSFPLGIEDKYKNALYVRTLMLNCLTTWYAPLWEDMWNDEYLNQSWSIDDERLTRFSSITPKWQRNNALRNYFERRQALVEIDVITAMALGLSLEDLEMIYTIQFPVLQQNEAETFYDSKGDIAFTVSRGLTGVGMSRKEWEAIPDKSAYTLPDRIADYRCAWSHFSKIFNQ